MSGNLRAGPNVANEALDEEECGVLESGKVVHLALELLSHLHEHAQSRETGLRVT